jgi:hypothetical protein
MRNLRTLMSSSLPSSASASSVLVSVSQAVSQTVSHTVSQTVSAASPTSVKVSSSAATLDLVKLTSSDTVAVQAKEVKPKPPKQKQKSKPKLPPPPTPKFGALIDIGANLTHHPFTRDTLPTLLRKSRHEADVSCIIITGTCLNRSKEAVALCREMNSMPEASTEFPKLYCTVGVHPHDAKTMHSTPNLVHELKSLIESSRDVCIAVGECGLDFDRNFSPQVT